MITKLSRRAELYDEQFAKTFPSSWEMQVLNKYLQVKGSLLDVGCGTGRHVVPFAKRKFDVFGVDKDKELIKAVRTKLKQKKLRAGLIVADACNLPFRNCSFGYIISMGNTLGDVGVHRKERENIVREMKRTAKRNSILIIELVHRYWRPRDLLEWLWNYVATTIHMLRGKSIEYGDYTEAILIDKHEEKLTFHAFTTKEAEKLFQTLHLSTEIEKRGRFFHDWFFLIGQKQFNESKE